MQSPEPARKAHWSHNAQTACVCTVLRQADVLLEQSYLEAWRRALDRALLAAGCAPLGAPEVWLHFNVGEQHQWVGSVHKMQGCTGCRGALAEDTTI